MIPEIDAIRESLAQQVVQLKAEKAELVDALKKSRNQKGKIFWFYVLMSAAKIIKGYFCFRQ